MNKGKKIFISHYSGDSEIANLLTQLIGRLSLDQITPWHSSDNSASGGISPGKIWFNELMEKIENSRALIVVLTPNSINKPWLYFESGIAQSLKECDIIPVCVGLDKSNVYPPLSQYQLFHLFNYDSVRNFLQKVLNKYEVKFDEELYKELGANQIFAKRLYRTPFAE